MEKVKKLMRTTPNALLCVLGAIVFLFVFYSLAYRTPLWDVWLAPNMDNDEVIYNRQIVSVITHGGPQGYFGYDETHAAIGRYGGWGPILIWAYALPGFLFGSSINTVFWCNILFGILGLAIFARAARLNVREQLVCAATLVCLWIPTGGLCWRPSPAGSLPFPVRMRCCSGFSRWWHCGMTVCAAGWSAV